MTITPEKIKFIEKDIFKLASSDDWGNQLIALLEKTRWASSIEKKVFISGLRLLNQQEGAPHGFSVFLTGAVEIENYYTETFKKSFNSIVNDLKETKRLPAQIKILVLDEYLKFFAVRPSKHATTSSIFLWQNLFFEREHSSMTPCWIHSEEGTKAINEIQKIKSEILARQSDLPIKEGQGPKQLVKRILKDPVFSENFKILLLDYIFPATKLFTQDDIKQFSGIKRADLNKKIEEIFFFNPRSASNKQYIQFKKNLLFTHFSVLYFYAKYDGPSAPIEHLYDQQKLSLTNKFNQHLYSEDLPFSTSVDSIKGMINDFYDSSSKI